MTLTTLPLFYCCILPTIILSSGTFLPSDPRFTDLGTLYRAAETTLLFKLHDKGGHTSWSAAWEACLWARLGRKEYVWQALTRITERYVNPRLFSIHPATQRQAAKGGGDCITCFREKGGSLADRMEPGYYHHYQRDSF